MRIRLSYGASEFVLRQTPGESGRWGDAQFLTSGNDGEWDAWVVYERLPSRQTLCVDPARVIFVGGEPGSVRKYDTRFLRQFGAVIAPQSEVIHPRLFVRQPAIPWWIGVTVTHQPGKISAGYSLTYDRLASMATIPKTKLASVICSDKSMTDGHRLRLRLVEKMRERFKNEIDFFGHGFTPIDDKWDAIAPYKYHIVLENTRSPHYWTEKLADAYLAGAFPLYCGCPNLADYFSTETFCAIDRNDPTGTLQTIERTFQEDRYAQKLAGVHEARDLVLNRYNLFPTLLEIIGQLPSGARQWVDLKPEQDVTDPFARRCKRAAMRLLFGSGAQTA